MTIRPSLRFLAWATACAWVLSAAGCSDESGALSRGSGGANNTAGSAGAPAGAGGTGGSGTGGSAGVGGSAGTGGSVGAAGSGAGGAGGSGGAGGGSPIRTVFVIVEENHNWDSIVGSSNAPYINQTLLPMSSYAKNYKGGDSGQLHPSEPNYIWMEAGSNTDLPNGNQTYTFKGDGDPSASNQSTTTQHLVSMLTAAGISWKSYQENLPANGCGTASSGTYAVKHNPMEFFTDVTSDMNACKSHIVPMTQLATDLQNNTVGRYNFITPNLCNDMHGDLSCLLENAIQVGDTWLSQHVPTILASQAYQQGGALFITWDESETQSTTCAPNCPSIGMIVTSPRAKGGGYSNMLTYDHSSFLKTMQEIFGVTPLLRHAGDPTTRDLADLFTTFP
jgi:phospholipase C